MGAARAWLRQSLLLLGSTPRALRLVWRTSPTYALAQLTIGVTHGLVPLAEGWLWKVLVDTVVVTGASGGDPSAALHDYLLRGPSRQQMRRLPPDARQPGTRGAA